MIESLETRHGDPLSGTLIHRIDKDQVVSVPADHAAEFPAIAFWHRRDVPQHLPTKAINLAVEVLVNGGRWLVQCPSPYCSGAQYASKNDRRFFCIDCLNVDQGGAWLRVKWPADPAAIEAALDARPHLTTRNWLPAETVADLHRENVEHAV